MTITAMNAKDRNKTDRIAGHATAAPAPRVRDPLMRVSHQQGSEKHPRRLQQENILLIRRKGGLPFRADPGSQRVSPPGQGPRPHEVLSRTCCAAQRPARRVRSARQGRVGRWPGALAPGWSRISAVPWQGRWPQPDRTGSLEEFCLPAKSPCGWHVCIGLPDGNRPARLRFPAVGIAGAEQRARRAVRVDGPWRQCQGRMRALSGTPAGPGCTGRAHGARRRAEGRGSRIACPVRGHPRGWRGRKRPSRRVTPC